ncbi:MAG: methyl-accepting chemotaxis protein [Clostridiales Family XIII bacterium]|jgi:methyl-accepting chemotaxis protein|nr:methyl-accepting chemotaxis protein [Clostridiales Family XIII bacterium]
MKNLRIKMKLLVGFLTVGLIMGVVGLTGVFGVQTIVRDTKQMSGIEVDSINVGELETNIQAQRALYWAAATRSNTGARDEALSNLAELKEKDAECRDLIARFTGSFVLEAGKARAGGVAAAYEAFAAARDDFASVIAQRDDGRFTETMTAAAAAAGALKEALDALQAYIADTAEQVAGEAGTKASVLEAVMLAVVAAGIGVAVVIGFYIEKLIARPIESLAKAADALAEGDIDLSLAIDTRDEIGKLARSFGNMVEAVHEQARVLRLVAGGDYREQIRVRSDKDVMNRSVNTVIEKNARMLNEISETASQVASAASQIAVGAQSLASGSSQQAAALEEFSATVSEVLIGAENNMEQSGIAYEDVREAGKHMERSTGSMNRATAAMEEIRESSENIRQIIKVIDDIAFQTNILALNAAVEAARAGVHGKGFAVVADEVRNLASKSAEAAKETAVLIETSSAKVSEGGVLVVSTGEGLKAVDEIAGRNALALQSISGLSKDQVTAISEINRGLSQISSVVQATSATAQEAAAAAEEMSAQAEILKEILSRFRLGETGKMSYAAQGERIAGAAVDAGMMDLGRY